MALETNYKAYQNALEQIFWEMNSFGGKKKNQDISQAWIFILKFKNVYSCPELYCSVLATLSHYD